MTAVMANGEQRPACGCVMRAKPKVVCLCGSTRFKTEFESTELGLTLQGYIVLTVGGFMHADDLPITPEQKRQLDWLHKHKINMADEVLVLNVDGYIGSSTKSEIEYAILQGKPVRYKYE